MADAQQNYLADLNAARQRARGAIRSRIDQIIDPMQSAAEMDRLQGTSVMQTTGQVDPGVNNVFRLAGGSGGGSAPVRTAVGGGKAPITATNGPVRRFFGGGGGGQNVVFDSPVQSSGQCQIVNGRRVCPGSSQATVVSQEPMGSTVEYSAPVATTVGQYAPVEYAPNPNALDPAYHMTRGIQLGGEATASRAGGSAKVSAMQDREATRAMETGTEMAHIGLRQQELEEQQYVNREKAKVLTAENALTYAQAGATRNTYPVGQLQDRAQIATEVFQGRMSHNDYADLVVRQHAASAGFSDETKDRKRSVQPNPAIAEDGKLAQVRKDALREISTGSIMYGLMQANRGLKQLADTPADQFGKMDLSASVPDSIGLSPALSGIARSYAANGAFSGDLSSVEQFLRSDLNRLNGAVSDYFADERRNDADFASLPAARQQEELNAARQRGLSTANAIFNHANNQMQAWWGQARRGEFNEADPYKPLRGGAAKSSGGWWPNIDFSTPKPVDSNDTLPPPKQPAAAPLDEARRT